jgi:hypothetical protein
METLRMWRIRTEGNEGNEVFRLPSPFVSFVIFCSTILLLALLSGCSQQGRLPLAPVSGVVTLDGVPVENASLEFIADRGGVAYGKTDASGRYTMYFGASSTGAILGKNLVRISSGDKVTVGSKKYESTEIFPKKYHGESQQYVEVVKGSNRFDFACESGGFAPRQVSSSRGGN